MEQKCPNTINIFKKMYILKGNHVANHHVWEPLA